MDQNQSEPTFEEGMKEVMRSLPPFIREYLAQGKYTPVAQGLMGKYKLRIDQGGVLERELLLLLMGIEAPNEFVDALVKEAQIDQETVNNIVQDINDQVFMPLRKQEEELAKNRSQSARPLAPQPAQPRPTPPAPKPAAPLPPHVAPLPPKMAMPKSASLGDIVRSVVNKPMTPPERTLPNIDPATLLEDHEEPHIDLAHNAPVPAAPKPVVPVVPAVPVAPAPHQMPPMPRPQMPVPPAPSASIPASKPVPPPTQTTPPVPPITSYSVDPYREPIDDEKE